MAAKPGVSRMHSFMQPLLLCVLLLLCCGCGPCRAETQHLFGNHRIGGGGGGGNGVFTETTHKTWFDEIEDSIVASVLGVALFLFGFPLLLANEGAYVQRRKALAVVRERLRQPPVPDSERLDAYGLIHRTGQVGDVDIRDAQFDMTVRGIRLRRVVEMYQFEEKTSTTTTRNTIGGGSTRRTTYSLTQKWAGVRLPLSGKAPGSPPDGNPEFPVINGTALESTTTNGRVDLDNLLVDPRLLDEANNWEGVAPHEAAPRVTGRATAVHRPDQCSLYLPYAGHGAGGIGADAQYAYSSDAGGPPSMSYAPPSKGEQLAPSAPPLDDVYDVEGGGPRGPRVGESQARIGDVRIHWEVVRGGEYTVLSARRGDQLEPYQVDCVDEYELPAACYPLACCGLGAVLLNNYTAEGNVVSAFRGGRWSEQVILRSLNARAERIVWVVRVTGFFCFWIGALMMLSPIVAILNFVSFFGSIASFGAMWTTFLVAALLTPVVVAASWVVYRPQVAGVVLLIPLSVLIYANYIAGRPDISSAAMH